MKVIKNSLGKNEYNYSNEFESMRQYFVDSLHIMKQIVDELEYTDEMMYNILMDNHEKIIVNNLICETLNPEHPYAKKYFTPTVTEINIPTMEIVCA